MARFNVIVNYGYRTVIYKSVLDIVKDEILDTVRGLCDYIVTDTNYHIIDSSY